MKTERSSPRAFPSPQQADLEAQTPPRQPATPGSSRALPSSPLATAMSQARRPQAAQVASPRRSPPPLQRTPTVALTPPIELTAAVPRAAVTRLPAAPNDDIKAADLQKIDAYLKEVHVIAGKNVTHYKLGQTNYHRLRQLTTPTVALAAGITTFAVCVYFTLTRTMLADPQKMLEQLAGMMSAKFAKDVPGAVAKAMEAPLEKLATRLDQQWDARWNGTMEQLMAVIQNATRNGSFEAPEGVDKVEHILEAVYKIAAPLIGVNGSLAQGARADTAQAVQGMVDVDKATVQKAVLDAVRDILVTGSPQVVQSATQYLNASRESAKNSIAGAWMFMVGVLGKDVGAAVTRSKMNTMSEHRQDFHKLLADKDTHERLMDLPPAYRKQAKKMIQALESDFANLARLEEGATEVKLDPARTRDVLEWLDKIVINGPTENKPVVKWATDRRQYLIDVLRDSKSYPRDYRGPVEYGCLGHAARSVFPPHVGGALKINLRGLPGMGKTETVNIIKKHTEGVSSKVTIEPEQMGEGGVADLKPKGWDAVDAVKFKTSYTQLLGDIMKERLLSGRNTEGYENGALNHISNFEEFPFDNPDAQRFLKPFLDQSNPWFYLKPLNIYTYTGGGTYLFDSNAKNVTSMLGESAHDDGATTSRFHMTQDYERVDPGTQQIVAQKIHDAALHIYATPFKIRGMAGEFSPILDHADVQEVRDTFSQLKDHLLARHNESFANLRMPYAQVLTELITYNLMKRKLLTPDERRELDVNILDIDGFKQQIDTYYAPFIKARQDTKGATELASGVEPEPVQDTAGLRRRKGKGVAQE